MTEAAAQALPGELETEITALGDLTFSEAVAAINGQNAPGRGLRAKFMTMLRQLQHSVPLSDPLFYSLAEAINRQCDRYIQLRTPIADHGNRWTGYPTDLLTQAEKDALT